MNFRGMIHRAGLSDDAPMQTGLAILALLIAPFVWSVLGLLVSSMKLFDAKGILQFAAKAPGVWSGGTSLAKSVHAGTYAYAAELKSVYALAFYAGMVALVLLLMVTVFSLASTSAAKKWAFSLEAVAVAFWAAPFWTYRAVATLSIAVPLLGLLVGYVYAVGFALMTSGIITAIFAGLIGVFVLGLVVAAAWIGFFVAFGPFYLVLRYVVPLGLLLTRPDGVGNRRLKRAFAGKNHFPFGGDYADEA
jgi:hypothetical protein